MVQATTTYGFIGLGQMGHGMAKNIRQKIPENCNLVIYDVKEEAMTDFVNDFGNGSNILAAASPKQVAELAVSLYSHSFSKQSKTKQTLKDVIMTSVPKAPHVKDVFLNPDTGLLAMRKTPGRRILFLELSTVDAAASTEVARAVIDGGFGDFVDAPCSVSLP